MTVLGQEVQVAARSGRTWAAFTSDVGEVGHRDGPALREMPWACSKESGIDAVEGLPKVPTEALLLLESML